MWPKKNLPLLLSIAAVVLIAAGAVWLARGHDVSILPAKPMARGDVQLQLENVTFRGIANGKFVWKIVADRVDFTKDQLTVKVRGLRQATLLKDGKEELTISADELERNVLTGDLSITGHVFVDGPQLAIRTPAVTWNDRRQVLAVPHGINAQFGDVALRCAQGAVFNLATSTLKANGELFLGVKGNTLQATSAVIEGGGSRFTLGGPIRAEMKIADVQGWLGGKPLPIIPQVPAAISRRYQEHMQGRPK